ncbi:MAG: hypothetical protein COS89_07485, partial [Deltaproteobacteria bacterium CG07_land_8_20_14_0_80_38_7]
MTTPPELFEEIKLYLPKYLSPTAEENLFEALREYPENIDSSKLYSNMDKEIIYQGDGLKNLLFIKLPEESIRMVNSMIVTNTCDNNMSNPRLFKTCVCYTPIISLKKYISVLNTEIKDLKRIAQHVSNLKKQKITQIFFLPEGGNIKEDSFVFLDRIVSCDVNYIYEKKIQENRLFSL